MRQRRWSAPCDRCNSPGLGLLNREWRAAPLAPEREIVFFLDELQSSGYFDAPTSNHFLLLLSLSLSCTQPTGPTKFRNAPSLSTCHPNALLFRRFFFISNIYYTVARWFFLHVAIPRVSGFGNQNAFGQFFSYLQCFESNDALVVAPIWTRSIQKRSSWNPFGYRSYCKTTNIFFYCLVGIKPQQVKLLSGRLLLKFTLLYTEI